MMRSHRLAKAILAYKATYNGREIHQVDQFYPSSKLCSHCGALKEDLTLNDRVYRCDKCGARLDRDYNASLNLLSQLKKHIGKVRPEFTPADLTALQEDLAINCLVTSKRKTGIQPKSH